MTKSLRLLVPASSANLGAGFDCASVGLGLHNEYQFQTHQSQTVFEYRCEASSFRKNLVEYAYKKTCSKYHLEAFPFHLKCQMRIPYAQGLGSSANAILAGVVLARFVHSLDLSRGQLLADAQEIETHMDNLAGSLYGGFNVSVMTNDGPINAHYPILKGMECLLIFFSSRTETDVSRKKLPTSYARDQVVFNISRAALLACAFARGDFSLLQYGVEDAIHQPFRLSPALQMEALNKTLLDNADFYALALSGSGPTIIAFCRQVTKKITVVISEHFQKCQQKVKVLPVNIDNQGLQILTDSDRQ